MNKCLITWACCLAFSVVQADLVTDDFNRDDQPWTGAMGTTLGTGWASGNIVCQANLTDGEVDVTEVQGSVTGFTAYRNDLGTLSSSTDQFEMSAEMRINQTGTGAWAGLVFNWSNGLNFNVIRFSAAGDVQVYGYADGYKSMYNPAGAEFSFVQNRTYKVTVSSDTPYTTSCSITDTTTSSVVWSTSWTDTTSSNVDGQGGLWTNSPNTYFDNFSLETIPEPTTSGLLGFSLIAALLMRRLLG